MFLNQGDELSLDPVLIDFGISFQKPDNFGGEPYNDKITDIATGYYKAPELLLTIRDYDETVDIWATGVMLMLMSSEDGTVSTYSEDCKYSDLALLSSILNSFGSPPSTWPEAQNSRSFKSLNENFFTKTRKSVDELIPKLKDDDRTVQVFQNIMVFEREKRLSAAKALEILDF
ncbi:unnamed protein product [Ambrosiozyma monospora]|uniref:Unnamed protein product n=1 Tax=Ambrosiozyma monospora TaxID=43982 RepID=A0ACB5T8S6_AMBMO|nr:unnamed protein product [Ambrosiozyma monospora]